MRLATPEEGLEVAKLRLEYGYGRTGFQRMSPQDRIAVSHFELLVEQDGDDKVFRTVEKIPELAGMGS